ncbi:hypothetical protein [Mesorhizobium sp. KR9-304]|uniref:hypothetical protein n=1 Tax=Mesorhizobium sp. KR9-304 TaxID=3156614 RepID=UPI0032B4FD30
MKIKFLTGFKPKGDAENIPSYEAGEVYDFSGPVAEGYARKYIGRGLAEEAKPAPKPAVVEAQPVEEKVNPPVAAKPFAFRGNKRK